VHGDRPRAHRILATAVTARFGAVRTTLLETFAGTRSLALQQTLYEMG
jgi:hypothetical protein